MKFLKNLMMMAAVLVSAMVITSCGSDDDDPSTGVAVVVQSYLTNADNLTSAQKEPLNEVNEAGVSAVNKKSFNTADEIKAAWGNAVGAKIKELCSAGKITEEYATAYYNNNTGISAQFNWNNGTAILTITYSINLKEIIDGERNK